MNQTDVSEIQYDTRLAGHPIGLVVLFFTELWERFSYYGMRGILMLYLVAATDKGGLGFDVAMAGAIYGASGSGVGRLRRRRPDGAGRRDRVRGDTFFRGDFR